MIKDATLNNICNFVRNLQQLCGDIQFALAFANTVGDENSSLTLVIAAHWIEEKGREESLKLITETMQDTLGDNANSIIDHISLVGMDDPDIKIFAPFYVEAGGRVAFNGGMLNGKRIEGAYLFANKVS